MDARIRRTRIILSILVIFSMGITGILLNKAAFVRNDLDREITKNASLLIEQARLNETLAAANGQLSVFTDKVAQLNKTNSENDRLLAEKNAHIKRLETDNATVTDLRKHMGIIEAERDRIMKNLSQMNDAYASIKRENDVLNLQLASVRGENEMLAINNSILKSMVADNYRIEALKGRNDRITVNAKRADKLVVSFDLPEGAGNGLHFQVLTPGGQALSSLDDGAVFIQTNDQPENLLASTAGGTASLVNKRTEMVYKPEGKMQEGVYTFNIYNNETYLGSIQLKLK